MLRQVKTKIITFFFRGKVDSQNFRTILASVKHDCLAEGTSNFVLHQPELSGRFDCFCLFDCQLEQKVVLFFN